MFLAWLSSPATPIHHPKEVCLDPGHSAVGKSVPSKPILVSIHGREGGGRDGREGGEGGERREEERERREGKESNKAEKMCSFILSLSIIIIMYKSFNQYYDYTNANFTFGA